MSIYSPCVAGQRFFDVVVVVFSRGWQVEVDVGDGGMLEVAGRDHRGVLPALSRVQGRHVEVNLESVKIEVPCWPSILLFIHISFQIQCAIFVRALEKIYVA